MIVMVLPLFFFEQKKYRKGFIDVAKIKCVEIVKNDEGVVPCQNKYPFQVSWHDFLPPNNSGVLVMLTI